MSTARQRGVTSVLLEDGTGRIRGKLWRHPGAYQAGRRYVPLDHMLHILAAAAQVQHARLGNATFRQKAGLPIGGPMSDLGPGLLLGAQEAAWRQMPRLRRLSGFGGYAGVPASIGCHSVCR